MKRFLTLSMVAALVTFGGSVAYANYCAFDPVPAATLLYPFVQLDFNSPVSGDTTLFSFTNVSDEATIVHVTVWTDFSLPILDFNVVLSGYDVQTMNIRDIMILGDLPNTGTRYNRISHNLDYDLNKTINPVDGDDSIPPLGPAEDGPLSEDGVGFDPADLYPSQGTDVFGRVEDGGNDACPYDSESYPDYPLIPESTLAVFQFYLTYVQQLGDAGLLWHSDDCLGLFPPFEVMDFDAFTLIPDDWWQLRNTGQTSWMYITADVVQVCNKLFPFSAGYWDDAVLSTQNMLIGDVLWVNEEARFSEADLAVHIEAAGPYDAPHWQGYEGHTFYYWFSGGVDLREPLPTAWGFRYIGAGTAEMDTYVRAWKDTAEIADVVNDDGDWFGWAALDCYAYTYYAWDEDENFLTIARDPWSAPVGGRYVPNLLPLETQEVEVDQFELPDVNGWMLFIWPYSNNYDEFGAFTPWPWRYQTWMGVKYAAYGNFSAALSGAVIANANCFNDQVVPELGINYANVGGAF